MTDSNYPAGWDAGRVRRLIDRHEALSDDELAAEDDAAAGDRPGHATITVPSELLPAIRQLLARHKSAGAGAAPAPAAKPEGHVS